MPHPPRSSLTNSDSPRLPISASPSLPHSAPPLSPAEKRLYLAQLVRTDLLDCLDDSGAFDLTLARQVLTGGMVQQLTVDEVTRTDRAGNTTVRRKITVRLVDKVRAIKLDDTLETSERRARAEAEEQHVKAEQSAQESQARAAAFQQYADVGKEVEARVWAVLHHLAEHSASDPLSGLTIENLNDALEKVSRRLPRPPP